MGRCPCPRCHINLKEVQDLGNAADSRHCADTRRPTRKLFNSVKKARQVIFQGYKVSGTRVERLLAYGSRVAVNVIPALSPPHWLYMGR